MRVIEVQTSQDKRRYVVIDDQEIMIEPIVRYLKYLDLIGAARNTLHSYAIALKHYWQYLAQEGLDWQQVTLAMTSLVSCSSLSCPPVPSGCSRPNPFHRPVLTARSTMRSPWSLAFTTITGYHWRMEAVPNNLKDKMITTLPARARRYKGFLHHLTKGSPVAKNVLKQQEDSRRQPQTITKE